MHAEVDHDRAGFTLAEFHADAITVARRGLQQHWQRVVVAGKAHGLARLQAVDCARDGGGPESLDHATGAERVDGVSCRELR